MLKCTNLVFDLKIHPFPQALTLHTYIIWKIVYVITWFLLLHQINFFSIICLFHYSAGEDYAGISRNLDFAPGVTMQTVRVYILDDLGQPILEGPETFELVLTMPMNAVLGAPALTVVTINDTISDCKYRG